MSRHSRQRAEAASQLPANRRKASPLETLEAGRVMARALAENADDHLALAHAFGARTIAAWWRALALSDTAIPSLRQPPQSFDTLDLPASAEALADSLGAAAGALEPEAAAHQIGLIYTCTLPRARRAALGIYYTPPSLTARLIARASECGIDWTTCRVLDPACGGGAFLAPVARRIVAELPDCSPRILVENLANRLRGYEIDPFGAWLSQVTLDAALLPVTRAAGRQLPDVVTVCDALRTTPPDGLFDLVIGNPPYRRIRLPSPDRARFRRSLFGHANLYGLFTDVALRHARPGGVVAYVTPTSFLAGEYFKNLRSLLGREGPPATLDFISVRKGVFDGVLQETLLATYKRGSSPAPVAVREITPASDGELAVEDAGSFDLPADPSDPWILPRCARQAPVATALARTKHRLADWGYTVSTGPLVWNRHKDRLAGRPGRDRYPLIWSEAVAAGGGFAWPARKPGRAPWFEIRGGDEWLIVRSPCVLVQRTTAKEQTRRLVAAALPSGFLDEHGAVVIENHLNMLRPLTERPPVSAGVLAAFLNSGAADDAFRCVSGSVAVSAYELESLPLPAPNRTEPALSRLIRNDAGRAQIEAACASLYSEVA